MGNNSSGWLRSLVSQPAARIVGTHGYRIDGDVAHLHADIERRRGAGSLSAWALQLWALPLGPSQDGSAVKVAELPLRDLAANDDGVIHVRGSDLALPPAGAEPCTMVLQLADSDGAAHDQVAFPLEEQFVQPRLQGGGYRFDGDAVHLQAARIENPRDAGNLSGHLVLELWALPEAYHGGAFTGTCLGSAGLGRLEGQASWFDLDVTAAAGPRRPAFVHTCLMLREWTAAGYVTRDYVEFAPLPGEPRTDVHRHAAPTVAVEVETPAQAVAPVEPLAEMASVEAVAPVAPREPLAAAKPVIATRLASSAARLFGAEPAAVEPEAPSLGEAAAAAASVLASMSKPAKAKAAPSAKPAAASGVSVNRATVEQLAAIKGLSKPVAKAIVAGRPFTSLDGLLELKGIGPKLLEKLRGSLSL